MASPGLGIVFYPFQSRFAGDRSLCRIYWFCQDVALVAHIAACSRTQNSVFKGQNSLFTIHKISRSSWRKFTVHFHGNTQLTARFPASGYESWLDFQARVQAGFAALTQHSAQENIAVFTSATPIAIAVGAALQLTSERVMGLAWVMYNAGVTTMKLRDGAFHLYTLNAASHLLRPEMQTFR